MTLMEVSLREFNVYTQPGEPASEEKETKAVWSFRSDQKDPETGDKQWYSVVTRLKYGHPKAGLTKLLDAMFPHLSTADRKSLDTDDYINYKWEFTMRKQQDQKGDDVVRHTDIEPYIPTNKTAGKAAPQEADDPFAEE